MPTKRSASTTRAVDAPPIPAELIAGEPPFSDGDLDEAFDVIAAGGYDPADLLALSTDEISGADDAPPAEALVRTAGWRIRSLDEAEWAGRRLSASHQEIDALRVQASEWRARIDEWERSVTEPARRRLEFFERALAAFGLERRAEDEKRNKSTVVPSARVATRASRVGGEVAVVDEDKVLAWAVDALDQATYERVIKTVEKVLVSELRKIATISTSSGDDGVVEQRALYGGEPIPGTEVLPETVTVSVTPA